MGDELALREAALERVAVLSERFGTDGLAGVLAEGMLAEAEAQPSQRDREIVALAEMLRFDLMTLSGVDIPPLARVQEARRRDPVDLSGAS